MDRPIIVIFCCLAIMAASLAGGFLPLMKRVGHLRLQIYLSFSAGAMLGAAFFHMLPHAAEWAGHQFGLWTAAGVVGLYIVERFLSPHSHDTSQVEPAESNQASHCRHDHRHDEGVQEPPEHAAAPLVAGWSAVVGLFIHNVINGFALAGTFFAQGPAQALSLGVFLATVFHQPADSLTISTLLIKSGVKRSAAVLVQFLFALVIPVVVVVAFLFLGQSSHEGPFTGCLLAFSAGTFLCISLSDLLPEVQFHTHDRTKLFGSLLAGLAVMWLTTLFESSHGHDGPAAAPETHEHGR